MFRIIRLLLILVALTSGSNTFSQNASIILSDPFIENSLNHFTVTDPGNEPYTVQTTIGGLECRQIPGSKYGYFNVDDGVISSAENDLIFTITYFDEGTDNLYFQYNATNSNNYTSVSISKTGTNTWITATVALQDASLRNAQNNGADFRIGTSIGYNNYVREITITIGELDPSLEPVPTTSGSSYSEFIGKSVAGYQVWFNTGTPTSGWFHWSNGTQPAVGNLKFEVYPDVREYDAADLTQTGFANLGNGEPSELFHSSNTSVINKHFDWMETADIEGVALQRFINGIGSVISTSPAASPLKVMEAAEATDRIFYICYDITSSGLDETWDDIIKFDWVFNIEQNYALTSSPSYATVNNKPVVQIWGTGFTGNHPGTEQETIDLINFLKARGCYVIGGLPTNWRTETGDSKPGFIDAYREYDMISPWSVGRFGDVTGANNFKNTYLIPDKAFADAEGIDYMPVLFPGFSWSQWNNGVPNTMKRHAGDFLWNQALNIEDIGVSNMYFAMFDEYDEGTALMKAATDYSMIPTDQYFVTLSADGVWTSSDFYLRLAGAATDMLNGSLPVTTEVNIPYSEGPVYYRNSFEQRFANYDAGSGYFNVDPCFHNDVELSANGVSGQSVTMENNEALAHIGLFTTRINGTPTSTGSSQYYYQVAETKIGVKSDMELKFWKYSDNVLGQYTSIDLLFESGKRLKDLPGYVDNNGSSMSPNVARGTVGVWEEFSCQIGVGELVGDTIVGIIIGYDNPSNSGVFTAHFDDIVIEDGNTSGPTPLAMVNPMFHQWDSPMFDGTGSGPLYTADPSAHVWDDGRLYVYASHDLEPAFGSDHMDRYHVFSTDDMTHWIDHGEILRADQVVWGRSEGGFMWAPDCAYNPNNDTYYFYYPHPSGTDWGATWKIGVATSSEPAANFTDQGYIEGLESLIDPCVFIDDDGTAYLYHGGGGRCMGGTLDPNDWTKVDGPMQEMEGLVDFHEAAWVHKYDGKYYLSHSDNHGNDGNQLRYAMSDSPLGPWTDMGVFMYAHGSLTHHGSIVEYQGKWWSFYHTSNFSNEYNLRSVCVDELKYNPDGTMQVVKNWGDPFNGPHVVTTTANTVEIALTLEAEDFNDGGAHYGYWDRDEENKGSNTTYRPDSWVDLENRANNVINVGFMDDGEWLRYTIDVEEAGLYDIDCIVASGNAGGGGFHLSINGTDMTGNITVPFTGADWQTWTTVTAANIVLQEGEQYLDMRIDGGYNIDKFQFRKSAPYAGTPYNGPHDVPGIVEAEDFDIGGQGVAYFDTDPLNNSGAYRTDEGVDLENSNGSIHISWSSSGEWSKYTLNVLETGTYDIKIPVSTGNGASGSLYLTFDDITDLPSVSINTGGWNTYDTLVVNDVELDQGIHVLKLNIGGNINVDRFEFILQTDTTLVTPEVSISVDQNDICSGTNAQFTAVPVNGGLTPTYQWKLNGSDVGTNSPSYNNSALSDGDEVMVEMTSSSGNTTINPVVSNTITIHISENVTPSVTITESENDVCDGTLITFVATPLNGGASPDFQWKLNGTDVGTNSPDFSSTFSDGDQVSVQMTSSLICTTVNPVNSSTTTLTIYNVPDTPVISGNNIVECNSMHEVYSVVANSGSTYNWELTPSAVFTGQGSNEIAVDFSGIVGTTTITVEEINNGCTSEETSMTIDPCISSLEFQQDLKALIYPNPFTSNLNLSLDVPVFSGTVTITSLDGVIGYEIHTSETDFTIVPDLPPGVYIMRVEGVGHFGIYKVFKIN